MLSSKLRRAQRALDKHLQSPHAVTPREGWLAAIRSALGMTGPQFANRLGVARQSMDDLERSEAAGTITLNSLSKAAAALDCRLVYALVPNAGSLEALVDQRARQLALTALARINQTMLLEEQSALPEDIEHRIADYIKDHLQDRNLWDAS